MVNFPAPSEFDSTGSTLSLQPADDFHAGTSEHIVFVGRVWELAGQILPGEVEVLVQIESPFRAIGHIVDDAFVGDKFSGAVFAILPTQFEVRDEAMGYIHARDYTRKSRADFQFGDYLNHRVHRDL